MTGTGKSTQNFISLIGYYDCTIRSELRFQKVARADLILFDLRQRFPIEARWILTAFSLLSVNPSHLNNLSASLSMRELY